MRTATIPLAGMKAVIFDMDGTMVNNAAHHKRAWQELLRRHNITLSETEFQQKVTGRKNEQILEAVFDGRLDRQSSLRYASQKEALYRKLFRPDIKEIAGLSGLIETIHALGIKTAIATTSPAKNRQFVLGELGLEGKFAVILGDEHVTRGKPHPEIYLATAEQLCLEPSECLVFEDSPPGVAAGKGAGMTVVGILSSHTPEELGAADYVVDDFAGVSFAPRSHAE